MTLKQARRRKVSYWHEGRTMWVDERTGPTVARKLLNGQAPNLSYPIEGQTPCVFATGEQITIDIHHLWITISRVTAKSGKWQIEYMLSDFRPNLLGKKTGYTHSRKKALVANYTDPEDTRHDELEAVEPVEKTPEVAASESEIRRLRRQLLRERKKVENGELARTRMESLRAEIDRLTDRAA